MFLAAIIFLAVCFIIDYLNFIFVKEFAKNHKEKLSKVWDYLKRVYVFFSITFFLVLLFYLLVNRYTDKPIHLKYNNYMNAFTIFFMIYLPKFVVSLLFGAFKFLKFFLEKRIKLNPKFILLFLYFNLFFSLIVFGKAYTDLIIYRNVFNIEKVEIYHDKIPQGFDKFKIVQISDLHLGSFEDTILISKAVDEINKIVPDIIVFTGDLINNDSKEVEPFINIFKRLNSNYGKYAVLGNHDMGDYRRWGSVEEKKVDLNKLITNIEEMGFVLLRNDSRIIRKDKDSIALLGVDSWGKLPFKQYGKLQEALKKSYNVPFKILLSHNPTHFRAEILSKTDIFLTLSGHTHGMQFTFKFFNKYWSPFSFVYEYWCGLYENAGQYLYVNRGLGYLGFKGRIGLRGEITLITLHKS